MTDFPCEFFRSWVGIKILHLLLFNNGSVRNISFIQRQLGVTYSQIWKKIGELKEIGLVQKKQKGREMILTLTEKGRRVAKSIDEILMELKK